MGRWVKEVEEVFLVTQEYNQGPFESLEEYIQVSAPDIGDFLKMKIFLIFVMVLKQLFSLKFLLKILVIPVMMARYNTCS